MEILPLLTAALDNGEPKKPAPPMQKMRKATPTKEAPPWKLHVCQGCGYEYDPRKGDEDNGIIRGTDFEDLDIDWECPLCGASKEDFETVEVDE